MSFFTTFLSGFVWILGCCSLHSYTLNFPQLFLLKETVSDLSALFVFLFSDRGAIILIVSLDY